MPKPPIEVTVPHIRFNPRIVQGVILLLFILWGVLTSFYTVPSDSTAVVLRFGKFIGTEMPGLRWKMPFGIDEVTIVATGRQLKLEFGYTTQGATNADQPSENPGEEKTMVTGDLSAALVAWVVQYRIDQAKMWLFDVSDPGQTLRDLSEAVMREIVGDRTVDEVITVGRQEIEVEATRKLAEAARLYGLGVIIDQVQLKDVHPPIEVQASFDEVNRAQQERENMINVANGEYNKIIPRARGEAEQKKSAAQGYKLKRVNEAQGEADAFVAVLREYLKAPDVTRTRLYLETMAEVLPQAGPKILVDESVKQVLPMFPGAAVPQYRSTAPATR